MKNIVTGDIIATQKIQWVEGKCEVVWLPAIVVEAAETTIRAIRSDNIEVAFLRTSSRWRVPDSSHASTKPPQGPGGPSARDSETCEACKINILISPTNLLAEFYRHPGHEVEIPPSRHATAIRLAASPDEQNWVAARPERDWRLTTAA